MTKKDCIVICGPFAVQYIAYGVATEVEALKAFERDVHFFPETPQTDEQWESLVAELCSGDEDGWDFVDVSRHTARKIDYLLSRGREYPSVLSA